MVECRIHRHWFYPSRSRHTIEWYHVKTMVFSGQWTLCTWNHQLDVINLLQASLERVKIHPLEWFWRRSQKLRLEWRHAPLLNAIHAHCDPFSNTGTSPSNAPALHLYCKYRVTKSSYISRLSRDENYCDGLGYFLRFSPSSNQLPSPDQIALLPH